MLGRLKLIGEVAERDKIIKFLKQVGGASSEEDSQKLSLLADFKVINNEKVLTNTALMLYLMNMYRHASIESEKKAEEKEKAIDTLNEKLEDLEIKNKDLHEKAYVQYESACNIKIQLLEHKTQIEDERKLFDKREKHLLQRIEVHQGSLQGVWNEKNKLVGLL